MFDIVQFDIAGICNADCSWCISGKQNRNYTSKGDFMSVELFEKTIKYLKQSGFLNENGWLALYMWGDPFLHPKIKEIMEVANDYNMPVGISTNASKKILFDKPGVLSNVRSIWFSMPGFSQDSYDKCHGFNFEKIKSNIIEMSENFYKVGGLQPGRVQQIFHMYQYNLLELGPAAGFASNHNLSFWPYAANFNDSELLQSYITKTMDYDILEKSGRELFLTMYDKRSKIKAPLSEAFCSKQLFLDEYANVVLCCNQKSTVLGSVFDMKPKDVVEAKKDSPHCKTCIEYEMYKYGVMQMQEFLPLRFQ